MALSPIRPAPRYRSAWLVTAAGAARPSVSDYGWDKVLSRFRVGCGLAVAVVGTIWTTGGGRAVGEFGHTVLEAVPTTIVITGIVLVFRVLTPLRMVAGPLILVGIGTVALAIQFGLLRTAVIGRVAPVLVVVAGGLIAMSSPAPRPSLPVIVQRVWSVFGLGGSARIEGPSPHKFIVRSLYGNVRLDFTATEYPPSVEDITVDVTMIGGRVELVVPGDWNVRAGRLALSRGITFKGEVDRPPAGHDAEIVILNVQGWSGTLEVRREAAQSGQ